MCLRNTSSGKAWYSCLFSRSSLGFSLSWSTASTSSLSSRSASDPSHRRSASSLDRSKWHSKFRDWHQTKRGSGLCWSQDKCEAGAALEIRHFRGRSEGSRQQKYYRQAPWWKVEQEQAQAMFESQFCKIKITVSWMTFCRMSMTIMSLSNVSFSKKCLSKSH